jgi:hypothetical protein
MTRRIPFDALITPFSRRAAVEGGEMDASKTSAAPPGLQEDDGPHGERDGKEAAFVGLPRMSALSFPSEEREGGKEGGRDISGLPSLEWVEDMACNECMVCGCEFTLTRRRHHVRACGGERLKKNEAGTENERGGGIQAVKRRQKAMQEFDRGQSANACSDA